MVTGISSLLFMILDPAQSDIHGHQHPTRVLPPGMEENMIATVNHMGNEGIASLATRVVYFGGKAARMQEEDVDTSRTNAVAVIFQCVSALLRPNLFADNQLLGSFMHRFVHPGWGPLLRWLLVYCHIASRESYNAIEHTVNSLNYSQLGYMLSVVLLSYVTCSVPLDGPN